MTTENRDDWKKFVRITALGLYGHQAKRRGSRPNAGVNARLRVFLNSKRPSKKAASI